MATANFSARKVKTACERYLEKCSLERCIVLAKEITKLAQRPVKKGIKLFGITLRQDSTEVLGYHRAWGLCEELHQRYLRMEVNIAESPLTTYEHIYRDEREMVESLLSLANNVIDHGDDRCVSLTAAESDVLKLLNDQDEDQ